MLKLDCRIRVLFSCSRRTALFTNCTCVLYCQGGREVDDFIKYLARESTDGLSGYDRDGKKIKKKKDKKEEKPEKPEKEL